MPAYPGAANAIVPVTSNASPLALNPGDSIFLFGVLAAGATQLPVQDNNVTFEAAPAGTASIAACLAGRKEGGSPPSVSLEVIFNGNPGVFEFDLQEASIDADGCYLTPAPTSYKITAATQKGANWVAFADDIPTGGKFQRGLFLTNPNGVSVIAKLTALA